MRLFRRSRSACRRYDVQINDDSRSATNAGSEYTHWHYQQYEQERQQQLPQWSPLSHGPNGERSSSCQGHRRDAGDNGRSGVVRGGGWRSFAAYQLSCNSEKADDSQHLLGNCFGLGVADVVVVACRDVTSSDQLTQTEFEFSGGRRHTLQYTPRTSTLPLSVASPGSRHRRPLSPGTNTEQIHPYASEIETACDPPFFTSLSAASQPTELLSD